MINFKNIYFKVCQQFLLKTLHISQTRLVSARNQSNVTNIRTDKKKSTAPHNKSDPSKVNILKNFIEQLPAVPSHYCRNKSKKMYLPQEFRNIKGLYDVYKQHLKNKDKESDILSLRVFRHIFKNCFHIGFHLPKKDKCVLCEKYNNLDREQQLLLNQTDSYQNHIRDKNHSKEIFLKEQKDKSLLCASFDLQKVLNTPHGKNITLFYSRKYAYYNESIYENGTRNGYCFLWGETDGKRGCNEICTIIFQYLKIIDERKTHTTISLYCDSCAGQNRNRSMLATIFYFLKESTFVTNIKITYLLPGHTMMPVDSIHSTIESFVRNRTVWAPSEWYTLISNSRTNPNGYKCIAMSHTDFKNWKQYSENIFPNSCKLSIQRLRCAIFQKDNPIITLKYGYFENSETKNIDTNRRNTRRNLSPSSCPQSLYEHPLPISRMKYNDLTDLCNKNIIPPKFHGEYINLNNNNSTMDTLPETDEED